jgi:hypothetical protein
MSIHRLLSVLSLCLVLASASQAEDQPVPQWSVPAGWTKLDQQKPMRYATYVAGEGAAKVEIQVSVFPGDVGGLHANVNRWRGQVGLPPITPDQLAANVTAFEVPGFTGHTMRLKGDAQHMLGAAVKDVKNDRTWFVKTTGTPAAIDAQDAAFTAFARSFTPAK